ncbi:MAG: peptidylprolyl isomerase [Oscillospiraceae bacterium]|jgi:hypothetical protein|nr:peptidylprolyl isomerase [Oscillospiraceae bacterium]
MKKTNLIRRAAILLLCAAMAAAPLTGCADTQAEETPETAPQTDESSPQTGADVETPAETSPEPSADSSPDFAAANALLPPSTVMMTINGESALWDEYFFANYAVISSVASNMASSFGAMPDWDFQLTEDMTFGEFVADAAYNEMLTSRAVDVGAQSLGISLTDEARADIDSQVAALEAQLGGAEELAAYFESVYCSEAMFRRMMETDYLRSLCFAELYGENGGNLSDGDIDSYAETNGFMMAKHILKLTMDMSTRQPLPDDEIAAARAAADEILAELDGYSGDDFGGLFDELMNAHSEDSGLPGNPGGYLFAPGSMVASFEDATRALEIGEHSGIVESEYGLHIIYRLPVDYDASPSSASGYTLRYMAASELFERTALSTWRDSLTVELTDAYTSLDLSGVF